MSRKHILASIVACCATLAAANVEALTVAPALAPAAAPQPLSDSELAEMRGGFMVDGVNFEFGALIKTYEGGALALQTQVTWTGGGAVVDHLTGAGVTPAAVTNADLSALTGAGAAFTTASGAALVQNFANGQLINLLANRNSNLDFRQETNLTLVLPGFVGVQSDFGRSLAALRMTDDLNVGAVGALAN